jgi:hypothetical protein
MTLTLRMTVAIHLLRTFLTVSRRIQMTRSDPATTLRALDLVLAQPLFEVLAPRV